jgi:tRNA U34 5-methylaminomethyl-2-thiouridine-forming methyltransferase MnmC
LDDSFTLVTVASGARSLRSLAHGETFHPVVGPMVEARALHVGQSRLRERARGLGRPFVVWDVGLGAAANAIAVIENISQSGLPIALHSFDCTTAPLAFARAHAEELRYLAPWSAAVGALLAAGRVQVGGISWHLHLGDFRAVISPGNLPPAGGLRSIPAPDAILYDPYSPKANPGLWTLEHFTRLRACAGESCTLTSYSRSTSVRVTLALAGFFVGRGTATGEKDETTIAATRRELLADPLGEDWLTRVGRSTRGGPLREGRDPSPITDSEFAALRAALA